MRFSHFKEGDNVVKKTTTYEVNESTGIPFKNREKEIFKQMVPRLRLLLPHLSQVFIMKRLQELKVKLNNIGTPGTQIVTTIPRLILQRYPHST